MANKVPELIMLMLSSIITFAAKKKSYVTCNIPLYTVKQAQNNTSDKIKHYLCKVNYLL